MEVTEKVKVGMVKKVSSIVDKNNTALAMKSGTLEVYATPAMTALMEQAAAELLQTVLPEGWTSVGIAMSVVHTSASPVGMKVKAEAKVIAVDRRKVSYEVVAFDEVGEIGKGSHERFAVEKGKFLQKAASKKNN